MIAVIDWQMSAVILGGLLFSSCVALYINLLPPHKRGFLNGKRYVMPSGPRGWPLVGNMGAWFQARRSGTVPWVMEQARYGEMTTLSMGTRTWVLLNSTRVIAELISKRTNYTHERPEMPIAGALVSRNMRPFLKRAADWKEGRHLVHRSVMTGTSLASHGRIIEDASVGLLRAYLTETPATFDKCHYKYGTIVMYSIVANAPLEEPNKNLENLQAVTTNFLEVINSTYMEFFPQLTRLPTFLQPWRPYWENVGTFHYNVFKDWWVNLKPLSSATNPPSPLQTIVREFSGNEDEKMYLVIALIVAGSDNPRLIYNSAIIAFATHPNSVKRARDELDLVCGSELRLPNLEDLPRLPYICAIVKEVLRWRPVASLLPPRVLVKDLDFEGYSLPAGTEFYVNMMAVRSDGHEHPTEFHPERWLGGENDGAKKSRGDVGIDQNLWQYAFAAGKRSCVGWQLAQKELFVTFARLLYCFNFAPADDINLLDASYHKPGALIPVHATVRSPAHEHLILKKSSKCTTWGEVKG